MATKPPRKQSLLKKALHQNKILTQEVLMYQRLMEVMRGENSFEDILRLLVMSLTEGMGYDRAGIFLVDREKGVGYRAIGIDCHGKWEGRDEDIPLSPVKGTNWFSDFIHGHLKGLYTNNFGQKLKKAGLADPMESWINSNALVPIMVSNQQVIGVLAVDTLFSGRRLKKLDLLSLMNFATQAGLAIESFHLHEKIRELTLKDGLTGVFNRRYFDHYFPREVLRCRRYKRFLSLLYVDLDHFKNINDLYGHLAGDAVLRHVANQLVKGLRNVDMVVRMGGDEFAVILPEVGPDGAKVVAQRLFKSIQESSSPVEAMRAKGEGVGVTMGVACFSEAVRDCRELMKQADESLYLAKALGRNRVGDLHHCLDGLPNRDNPGEGFVNDRSPKIF